MAYTFTANYHGLQPITTNSTTQLHPLGTKVSAQDPTYGEGEFVYMKGVASTVIGDILTYQANATTRWAGTAYTGAPVAVAMSACVAAQFGWYQVRGNAVCTTSGTVAAGDAANYNAAGSIKSAAVTGKQIINMIAAGANGTPATNQAVYTISYPTVQSAIT